MWELGTIEGVGNLTCSREPFPHRASAHDEHKISSDDDIYHHSMQYFLEMRKWYMLIKHMPQIIEHTWGGDIIE